MKEEAEAATPTPTRGVPLMLDRQRYLRFSLRTMREMRAKFGPDALKEGFDTNSIAELLWFGLRGEDPELTVEAVEELVDMEQLAEVMAAVSLATGTQGVEAKDVVVEEKVEGKEEADRPSPAPSAASTGEPKQEGGESDASPSQPKPELSKAS